MSREVTAEPMTMQPSALLREAMAAAEDVVKLTRTTEHFTLILPKGLVTEGYNSTVLTEAVKTLEAILPVIVMET